MASVKYITVEVVYATPLRQRILTIKIKEDATIEMAINNSGILKCFPEINLAQQPVGVFSQRRKLSDPVKDGERIEIYRPLMIDPKEARRKRAKKGVL